MTDHCAKCSKRKLQAEMGVPAFGPEDANVLLVTSVTTLEARYFQRPISGEAATTLRESLALLNIDFDACRQVAVQCACVLRFER